MRPSDHHTAALRNLLLLDRKIQIDVLSQFTGGIYCFIVCDGSNETQGNASNSLISLGLSLHLIVDTLWFMILKVSVDAEPSIPMWEEPSEDCARYAIVFIAYRFKPGQFHMTRQKRSGFSRLSRTNLGNFTLCVTLMFWKQF
jgi:hypothetical protein